MGEHTWCEHGDKISKYTVLNYEGSNKSTTQRIQSWFCPECGAHGAQSEIIDTVFDGKNYCIRDQANSIADVDA